MVKKLFCFTICLTVILFTANGAVAKKPDHPKNDKKDHVIRPANKTLNIFKVHGVKKGLIKISKDFFYPGDSFSLKMVFPKSLKAVWSGETDIHLVIRMPDGVMLSLPLMTEGEVPDKPKSLFELELGMETIPTGVYQFAVILTNPEGDPLSLEDWYNGFGGLVAATTMKFKNACDDEDANCDGDLDPEALSVTPDTLEMTALEIVTISIAGGEAPYTIASSDEAIASVSAATLDAEGDITVTGEAEGTATITVTDNAGTEFTVAVTVTQEEEPEPEALSVTPDTLEITALETATISIAGGEAPYTIASSDEAIASVSAATLDAEGDITVTGEAEGTATITVTDNAGTEFTVAVTVTQEEEPEPEALSVTPDTLEMAALETATISIAGGEAPYTIASSDEAIASVSAATLDAEGDITVTGEAEGTATITVTDNAGTEFAVAVTVTQEEEPEPEALAVTPDTLEMAALETATISVAGGEAPYTIASSDEAIASVSAATLDAEGDITVTGEAEDTATITVTDNAGTEFAVAVTITAVP